MSIFENEIKDFNHMYRLPIADRPSLHQLTDGSGHGVHPIVRLKAFKQILNEECGEIDSIIAKLEYQETPPDQLNATAPSDIEILTELADLLGDIQVYCASEMAKFGLPQEKVLSVIMASNMSKLGVDGQPIYDGNGKVQKGPNYWKPEPTIQAYLTQLVNEAPPFNPPYSAV